MKYFFLMVISIVFLLISSSVVIADDFADEYTVNAGDLLTIDVINEPNLRTTTLVIDDGTITFAYIGAIQVEGMKITEIKSVITEKLSEGYIKYPVVTVSLISSKGKKIYIYGEVGRPGQFSFSENMTILQALAIGGGLAKDGLYGNVKIRRKTDAGPGYKDIEINLDNIVKEGLGNIIKIESDDTVIVERNKTFFIHGEVGNTGEFVLQDDMTLINAIAIARGIRPEGLYGKLKIRRKKEGAPGGYSDVIEVNLSGGVIGDHKIENTLLQPDDILIIERNKTFFIHGEVGNTGEFVLQDDMTLINALAIAGGIRPEGLHGKLKIRRKNEGAPGGYSDVIEVNLSDGVIGDNKNENTLLQPDDILIVERNKTYFMYGEVARPGEFVLKNDMTAFKAITLAGGFTKWGSPKRVKILRQNINESEYTSIKIRINDVIGGESSADIQLQPGDVIVASKGIL